MGNFWLQNNGLACSISIECFTNSLAQFKRYNNYANYLRLHKLNPFILLFTRFDVLIYS